MGAQSAQELGAAIPVETGRTTGGRGRGYGVRRLAGGERAGLIVPGPDGQPIGRAQRPRLVEAGALRAEVPSAATALAAAHEAADLFAQASLSTATWDSYTSHWADWAAWCTEHGLSALPALPEHVAAHLALLAVAHDENGHVMRDPEGRLLPGRLKAVSVGKRLAALNKFHEWARLDRPGDDVQVRRVMAGIRRSFGVYAQEQKAALTLPLLTRLLDVSYEPDAAALRDRAALLLSQHPGITAAHLVALDWRQIELTSATATLMRPSGTPVLITRSRRDAICPVAALTALRDALGGTGPVFQHLAPFTPRSARMRCGLVQGTGKGFTRQGMTATLRRRLLGADIATPARGLPTLSVAQQARAVADIMRPTAVVLRDRALLLTGWVGALRRSNLSWLEWRDITPDRGEYAVLLRFQKNDAEGHGHTVFLVRGERPRTDPVAAWEAWRDRVARELGTLPGDTATTQAVFTPIDRHGHLRRDASGRLIRLSPDSINTIVRRYVGAAGLEVGDFGAHSLRAGFITEAAEREIPLADIQAVSGHRSLEMVLRYVRTVDRQRRSPARRMGL